MYFTEYQNQLTLICNDCVNELSYSPLPSMHEVKSLIDLLEGQGVCNKLIHLQLLIHVVLHQFRNTLHTLPAWG